MVTFQPTCAQPTGPSFVQDPHIRSSWDIIRGSLAVIILCTWSILHLHVPPQLRAPPRSESRWRRRSRQLLRGLYEFQRKAKWAIMTMMLPELVLGCALESYLGAKESSRKINEFLREEAGDDEEGAVEWTLAHSMYANIGGFVLKFPARTNDETVAAARPNENSEQWPVARWLDEYAEHNRRHHRFRGGAFDWDVHPRHYALAEEYLHSVSLDLKSNEQRALRTLIGNVWAITPLQLLEARRLGIIDRIPAITEAEIQDKSKEDALVKAVAMLKVLMLGIGLAQRAAEGRASSQLEIMALAFACCALFSYLVLLPQPQDVATPTYITASRSPSSKAELQTIAKLGYVILGCSHDYTIPDFTAALRPGSGFVTSVGTGAALVLFGSIHLFAWDFSFPSSLEKWLWQVSAVLVTGLPLCWLLLLLGLRLAGLELQSSSSSTSGKKKRIFRQDWGSKVFLATTVVVAVVYKIPRVYLIVEAFRSTYYLPPESYISTWTSSVSRLP